MIPSGLGRLTPGPVADAEPPWQTESTFSRPNRHTNRHTCGTERRKDGTTESAPSVIPSFRLSVREWAWVELNYRPHAYQDRG